jgi:2-hydroxy fatty acid dioxygenase
MSLLTAIAYSKNPDHVFNAALLHGFSWIAQFLAHGLAEKRAPAILDNILGGMIYKVELPCYQSKLLTAAIVLAPFFVHLEILFGLGYKPAMHKRISNKIGTEITRIRQADAAKKRDKAKSS